MTTNQPQMDVLKLTLDINKGNATTSSSVAGRDRKSPYAMLSMQEADRVVLSECTNCTQLTQLPLHDALGHVLGEDIDSPEPHPPFPASIKDGYAVLASDGAGLRKVVGANTAGESAVATLQPGTCVRISTGAAVPHGADAVVQVEDTVLKEEKNAEEVTVEILKEPKVAQDIRAIGSDIAKGQRLLTAGALLGAAEIGILASIGRRTVRVCQKPKVAVLSTGNEIVEYTTEKLPYGIIRDSNRPQMCALLKSHRFTVIDAGIALDSIEDVVAKLTSALEQCDVLVTSGGVSMGEKDLLKIALTEHLKLKLHFGRVFMKPGKPTTFASGYLPNDASKRDKKFVFALPGNPVSAFVTYYLFVLPALKLLSGSQEPIGQLLNVSMTTDYKLDPRPEYVRAVLQPPECDIGVPLARLTDTNQMSSRLCSALQDFC